MANPLPVAHDDTVIAEATQYAVTFHQRGQLAEAEKLYAAILKVRPDHFNALHLLGVLRQEQGDSADAARLLQAALNMNPRSVEALCNLGRVLNSLNLYDETLEVCDRALAIVPDDIDALLTRSTALLGLGRSEQALAAIDTVLTVKPEHVEALACRANLLLRLDRSADALATFDRALAIKLDDIEALLGRGNALVQLGRIGEALAVFDRVLETQPDHAAALHCRGSSLAALACNDEALETFDKALQVAPRNLSLLCSYGSMLLVLGRREDALAAFEKALVITPDQAGALSGRVAALRALGRDDEAAESIDRAQAAVRHDGEALYARGNSLWALGDHEAAIAALERASRFNHPRALSKLAICRLAIADWDQAERLARALRARVDEGNFVDPLTSLAFGFEPAIQLKTAETCIRLFSPVARCSFTHRTKDDPEKLRIAYVSSNFRQHPVGLAIVELLERHDHARFEVIGMSYGSNDASDTRLRIARSFDRFHDVAADSDRNIARLLHDLDVHIAVDLNGLTGGCRPGVLAHRPAPIQVGYMGFAGTTGAAFIDYILADATVLPFDQQPFFSERIVHLPDCYHTSDATRPISPQTPARADLGLPERGLVFCCFNQSYKIAAAVFDIWMRLLTQVPDSVLWLSAMNDLAQANLRREALARGVDPARLIFAPRVDRTADHLARHRAADLFLDTLPYNAHSTAIDALWTGLPVVTCAGGAFAGRVAASLLKAAGLPELVTNSLHEYEALILKLATDPAHLASIRRKLEINRLACPLFDSDRFRRHIEAAYTTMWDIHRRGQTPHSFPVEPTEAVSDRARAALANQ